MTFAIVVAIATPQEDVNRVARENATAFFNDNAKWTRPLFAAMSSGERQGT
jgi:hypothetical protein